MPWPGTPASQKTPPINPPSMRNPSKLNESSTMTDVAEEMHSVSNELVVHEQAFANLPAQIAAQAKAAAEAAVENISSETLTGVTSFNTETGAVIYFPNLGMVNDQLGNPLYLTQTSDAGSKIIVGDSTPVTVTLNPNVNLPWFTIIGNDSSTFTTLTTDSGFGINGLDSICPGGFAVVFFDGTNFWVEPTLSLPQNAPAIAHEWLNSYDATTGAFTQTQPAASDLSNGTTGTGSVVLAIEPTLVNSLVITGNSLASNLQIHNTGSGSETWEISVPSGTNEMQFSDLINSVTPLTVNDSGVTTPVLDLTATQMMVSGSGSGSAVFSQPFQGSSYKKVLVVLNALAGTAAYTFPTAFSVTPDYFIGVTATGATVSAISMTAVTVTGSASTGTSVLEGY